MKLPQLFLYNVAISTLLEKKRRRSTLQHSVMLEKKKENVSGKREIEVPELVLHINAFQFLQPQNNLQAHHFIFGSLKK